MATVGKTLRESTPSGGKGSGKRHLHGVEQGAPVVVGQRRSVRLTAEEHALLLETLALGERVLSAYCTEAGTKLWVITEADRNATTVLLPEEY